MVETRKLKEALRRELSQREFQPSLIYPLLGDPDTLVGPLFSFLPQTEKFLRWHAVTSLGLVAEEISKRDLERGRVILRKLMWNLNDESGGIGWGCAEAMGEILYRVRPLAMEFSTILVSYIHEEENYLEQIPLIEGALWGIARASQTNPDTLKRGIPKLLEYLANRKVEFRIYAFLALDNMGVVIDNSLKEILSRDQRRAEVYWNARFQEIQVSELIKI